MPSAAWSEALRIHRSAAAAFTAAAVAVEPEAWNRPLAEGKWSPAQITDHLIQTYDVVLPEIRPSKTPRGQQDAVALFRQRAKEFEAAVQARPEARMTHAYFGTLTPADGVLFCARHIEHHCGQLD